MTMRPIDAIKNEINYNVNIFGKFPMTKGEDTPESLEGIKGALELVRHLNGITNRGLPETRNTTFGRWRLLKRFRGPRKHRNDYNKQSMCHRKDANAVTIYIRFERHR